MTMGVENEVPSFAWRNSQKHGAQVARAALPYLFNQVDNGVNCPLTMTYAVVPALLHQKSDVSEWLEKIVAPYYDPRDVPISEKKGIIMGMSMTVRWASAFTHHIEFNDIILVFRKNKAVLM